MHGQNGPGSGKSMNGSAQQQALREIFLGTLHMPLVESNKTLYASLDHPEVPFHLLFDVATVHVANFLFKCSQLRRESVLTGILTFMKGCITYKFQDV